MSPKLLAMIAEARAARAREKLEDRLCTQEARERYINRAYFLYIRDSLSICDKMRNIIFRPT